MSLFGGVLSEELDQFNSLLEGVELVSRLESNSESPRGAGPNLSASAHRGWGPNHELCWGQAERLFGSKSGMAPETQIDVALS